MISASDYPMMMAAFTAWIDTITFDSTPATEGMPYAF
jgi:hypothetical protein